MIWWLWTAETPAEVHTVDLDAWWDCEEPDVAWLGEGSWTGRRDNMGTGLR